MNTSSSKRTTISMTTISATRVGAVQNDAPGVAGVVAPVAWSRGQDDHVGLAGDLRTLDR